MVITGPVFFFSFNFPFSGLFFFFYFCIFVLLIIRISGVEWKLGISHLSSLAENGASGSETFRDVYPEGLHFRECNEY